MKKLLVLLFISLLFTGCGLIPEEEGGEGPYDQVYTTAQKEFAAEELFKQGKFDEALTAYEVILEESDASDKSTITWAMLKLSSISVSSDVRVVASNLGIQDYPTTINELIAGVNEMDTASVMPSIRNTEMFAHLDEYSFIPSPILALLYNLQESYPDGFDPIMDSFISATNGMDEVIAKLVTLPDNSSFDLEVSMFEDETFDSFSSSWPTDKNGNAEVVTLGKAEVYLCAAMLEGVRASVYTANSISLKIDLDGYWDIFGPLEGSLYTFDPQTGEINGLNENFDWTTMQDPVKYGLFSESEDATEVLAEAKTRYIDVFKYIKEAGNLLASRTSNDDFFISPANEMFNSEDWDEFVNFNSSINVICDKVIDSLENNTMIYIPMPSGDGTQDDYILSLGDLNFWPISSDEGALGVNLGRLFDKPLFAIENIIELDGQRGFVLYEYDDVTGTAVTGNPTTTYVDGTDYALKIVDTTFNGVLSEGISAMIPEYVPVSAFFAGHELTAAGETFTIDGEEFYADGSVFHYASLLSRSVETSSESEQVGPGEGVSDSSDSDDVVPDQIDFSYVEGEYLYMYAFDYEDLDGYYLGSDNSIGEEIIAHIYMSDSVMTNYYSFNDTDRIYISYGYYVDEENNFIYVNEVGIPYTLYSDGEFIFLDIEFETEDYDDIDGDSDTTDIIKVIQRFVVISDPEMLPNFDEYAPLEQ